MKENISKSNLWLVLSENSEKYAVLDVGSVDRRKASIQVSSIDGSDGSLSWLAICTDLADTKIIVLEQSAIRDLGMILESFGVNESKIVAGGRASFSEETGLTVTQEELEDNTFESINKTDTARFLSYQKDNFEKFARLTF